MASRENQGLQVALILFVMMTVVLGVTTYMFYRQSEERKKVAADAVSKVDAAEKRVEKAVYQAQALMYMVGQSDLTRAQIEQQVATDTQMVALLNDFDKDMNLFGAGLEVKDLNYRNLPKNIVDAIQSRNAEVTVRQAQNKSLDEKMTTLIATEQQRVTVAETRADKATTDLTQEQAKYVAKVAELQTRSEEGFTKFQQVAQQMTQLTSKTNDQVAAASKAVAQISAQNKSLKVRIQESRPKPIKKADGRITLTSPEGGFVMINLGSDDNLKVRTTFNVYEAGEVDLENASIKGRIEVVDVTGIHRAKARITDSGKTGNPILTDDVVFSEVFDPGQSLHVGLAGFMDLDKDGRSDRDYIKSVLLNNGATIDAELRDDGVPEGRMTDKTNYLIIGLRPGAETNKNFRDEFGRMTEVAVDRSIDTVSVDEIFRLIGHKPEVRRVSIGNNATEDRPNFQRRRAPGAAASGGVDY